MEVTENPESTSCEMPLFVKCLKEETHENRLQKTEGEYELPFEKVKIEKCEALFAEEREESLLHEDFLILKEEPISGFEETVSFNTEEQNSVDYYDDKSIEKNNDIQSGNSEIDCHDGDVISDAQNRDHCKPDVIFPVPDIKLTSCEAQNQEYNSKSYNIYSVKSNNLQLRFQNSSKRSTKKKICPKRQCLHCGKTVINIQRHMKTHTGEEKPYSCDVCNKTFPEKGRLRTHMRAHTKERLYICTLCDKTYTHAFVLKRHMMEHGEKRYECDICYIKFAHKEQLSNHINRHTGIFSCTICDIIFSKAYSLKSHMSRHNPKRQCSHCGKTVNNIQRHMKTHTEEKKYSCDVCNKTFSEKVRLRAHMRTHTKERLYICTLCDKTFTHSYVLKRHMMVHGEKRYECDICYIKFAQKEQLINHINRHTGIFSCTICDIIFSKAYSLKSHMARHNGMKHFACNLCEMKFFEKRYLDHHMKSKVHI